MIDGIGREWSKTSIGAKTATTMENLAGGNFTANIGNTGNRFTRITKQ